MRISVAISVMILAAAAWLARLDERRIASARDANTRLLAEAAHLGIYPTDGRPAGEAPITKRPREVPTQDIPSLAVAARALFGIDEKDRNPKERSDLDERLSELDSRGFIELISALQSGNADGKCLEWAACQFGTLYPKEALAFLAESNGLLNEGSERKRNVINNALFMWAWDEPSAALQWYRANREKSADFSNENTGSFLIAEISRQDPKLAFRLLDEFGISAQKTTVIMSNVSLEMFTDALAGLRGYAADRPDSATGNEVLEAGIKSLTPRVSRLDFDTASKWIDTAKFTSHEREILVAGMTVDFFNQEDTGRWIEWIGRNLSGDNGDEVVGNLVHNWAFNDVRAVGQWLTAAPDGPVKIVSVQAYASAVAEYEPETAAKWAMTLPAGKERDATLKKVYQKWPKDEPAAKEAAEKFRSEHGIE